nr:hypothetical protein [Microctonus hyperodae filamentous virus]
MDSPQAKRARLSSSSPPPPPPPTEEENIDQLVQAITKSIDNGNYFLFI